MPPSKTSKKFVEIRVMNIPVTFDPEFKDYRIGLDVGPDDTVTVLDFAETWQNESGIVTVAVAHA